MLDQILFPYLIITSVIFLWVFFKGETQIFQSNNLVLAIVITVILAFEIYTLLVEIYSGYIYESVQFMIRVYGDERLRVFLLIPAFILPLLNFKYRFRISMKFQVFIYAIFFSLLMLNWFVGKVSVIPGWHTTINPQPSFTNVLTIITLWSISVFGISRIYDFE
ncbi:MAG: hypothetical protein ACI8YQ_000386 [Polaribacter sp.]|jgi:hypothetical protein